MSYAIHVYCSGELHVTGNVFKCSGCGITGYVARTPGDLTLADIRVRTGPLGLGTLTVTDDDVRSIEQIAPDNKQLQAVLWELMELRRAARKVVNEHDYRATYNRGMGQLHGCVNRAGCHWWRCTSRASTQRISKERYDEASHLCCVHADEGERQGLWNTDHPMNQHWREDDHERRAIARKRAFEMIAEDYGADRVLAQEGAVL